MKRAELERKAWYFTDRDYKSVVDGKRSVLVNGPRGTTLAPLSSLSLEVLQKMARPRGAPETPAERSLREEAFRKSMGLRPAMPPGTRRG
jgi:hypothetical protein